MSDTVRVPREPTKEMIEAGYRAIGGPAGIYRAMLSAAPQSSDKEKRIERAYCAANDYINALTNSVPVPPESLEKIKNYYWQAVREV